MEMDITAYVFQVRNNFYHILFSCNSNLKAWHVIKGMIKVIIFIIFYIVGHNCIANGNYCIIIFIIILIILIALIRSANTKWNPLCGCTDVLRERECVT